MAKPCNINHAHYRHGFRSSRIERTQPTGGQTDSDIQHDAATAHSLQQKTRIQTMPQNPPPPPSDASSARSIVLLRAECRDRNRAFDSFQCPYCSTIYATRATIDACKLAISTVAADRRPSSWTLKRVKSMNCLRYQVRRIHCKSEFPTKKNQEICGDLCSD